MSEGSEDPYQPATDIAPPVRRYEDERAPPPPAQEDPRAGKKASEREEDKEKTEKKEKKKKKRDEYEKGKPRPRYEIREPGGISYFEDD